jgi:hypothetical protein
LNGLALGDGFGRNSNSSLESKGLTIYENRNEIHRNATSGDLTIGKAGLKLPGNSRESVPCVFDEGIASVSMSSKPFSQPQTAGKQPCKHPRVQIVSRDEDAEFVECLECREVFESSELKDMSIEESAEGEAQES